MTKSFKLAMSAIILIPVILIVLAGFFLQNIAVQKQDELMKYYARRDELVAQQQQLISLAEQLNKTAESMSLQQNIATQIPTAETIPTQALPQPTPPAAPQVVPAPAPRVTRAS